MRGPGSSVRDWTPGRVLAGGSERVARARDRHTGDGILAIFDSPSRAVKCAATMVGAAVELGLSVRAGVHTGELERVGDDVRGLAVHTAARVMALAPADHVLVSASTAALLDPATALEDAGSHEAKGLPRPVHVFRVLPAD